MQDFQGKTAVITGGAGGMGLAFAKKFAQARMNVVLADIEEAALQEAVSYFEERQQPVLGVVTDTMRRDSIEALLAESIAEFSKVHVLCNNAGVVNGGPPTPIWALPDVDWEWVMGVNFYGVLYGLQTFVPHMLEHGEAGHIVNTASIAAFIPGGGPYGVSKYGVIHLSEALHRDLAGLNSELSASVLIPGWVNTRIDDAERNRPGGLANTNNPNSVGLEIGDTLTEGMAPEAVAEMVYDAVENDRFYILPHPGWDDVVTNHAQAVVARGAPYNLDMMDLMAKRAQGIDV